MITIEIEVPAAKYSVYTIAKVVEKVLAAMNPEEDWSVWVNQNVDRILEVNIMSVN